MRIRMLSSAGRAIFRSVLFIARLRAEKRSSMPHLAFRQKSQSRKKYGPAKCGNERRFSARRRPINRTELKIDIFVEQGDSL